MTDFGGGRGVATADAGRAHHANAGAGGGLQFMQQFFSAEHRAGQRIADANGQRRDVGLAFLHDVEMRVKGRGLEHLREGKPHLVGQGYEVACGNLLPGVLDEMQMLDQEVTPPRPVAEQKSNLFSGLRIDLAALGGRFGPFSSLARMFERADFLRVMAH